MRQRFTSRIRPEFRKLLRHYNTYHELAAFLGTTPTNVGMMKTRGYMSRRLAKVAEDKSDGKYKARMLVKRY